MDSFKATFIPQEELARFCRGGKARPEHVAAFAQACRINCLYMIQKAGSGHIGTSFSSMEIMSWLMLGAMEEGDVFFSSKGHDVPALYSILTGQGKLGFDGIHALRRLGGLPGHPDVSTPGIVTNTGSLGMGIAKARGMAKAARLRGRSRKIYVLLGDGELQEGQIYESLQPTANGGYGEITAVVDHNKIQSDTWVSEVSDLSGLDAKFASFGWAVARCDGNDIAGFAACLDALARENPDRPKLIIADTVKGKGVSFMEWPGARDGEGLYGFHSGALSPERYELALEELLAGYSSACAKAGMAASGTATAEIRRAGPPKNAQHLVGAYERTLAQLGGANGDLVALDADLARDCGLLSFRDEHPDRFHECGIAEMDMVSMAGGLALSGLLPVVHSFASFLTARANEQIFNNATEKSKIVYSGFLAGVLPGGPGHSHQSVRDIALMGSVPGMTCLQPCCEKEVAMALKWAVEENPASTYVRMVSIPCVIEYELPPEYVFEAGKGCTVRPGEDGIVIAYGPVMLGQAVAAARLLASEGIRLQVVNLPWLNVVDDRWLAGQLEGRERLFTIDDHLVDSGQGAMLAARCAELGRAISVTRLGLTGIPACGRNDEVLAHHGLDAAGIADAVRRGLA